MLGSPRWARVIVAAEPAVVLAISPALLFPTPSRLLVLIALPILWMGARVATGRAVPATPLNAAIVLMLIMVAVSLYATIDLQFSLGKVAGAILGVAVYWAATRWLTTPARLRVAVGCFVLAGAALAVIGLLGTNFELLDLDAPAKLSIIARLAKHLPAVIRGVPGAADGFNPNAVAGVLVLFVPLQVGLLAVRAHEQWVGPARRPAAHVIEIVLLTLTSATLLLMQSRGAWLGLLIAALAILSALNWRRAAAIGSIAAAIVLVSGRIPALQSMVNPPEFDWTNTVDQRLDLWSSGLRAIRDFPFTGMGMNVFRRVMPVQYRAAVNDGGGDISHAHNQLIQVALDLGIPGLVAYVALWLLTAALIVKVYRQSPDRIYRVTAAGLGCGLIAHFVFGITDAIPIGAKVGIFFWIALALVVGLQHVAFAASGRPEGRPLHSR